MQRNFWTSATEPTQNKAVPAQEYPFPGGTLNGCEGFL